MKKLLITTVSCLATISGWASAAVQDTNIELSSEKFESLVQAEQINLKPTKSLFNGDFQQISRTSLDTKLYTGARSVLMNTILRMRF